MGPSIFRTEDRKQIKSVSLEMIGFNGAVHFQDGRPLEAVEFLKAKVASMGPSIFRTEDSGEVVRHTTTGDASMGPSIFRTEDSKAASCCTWELNASMGPSIFRTEDSVSEIVVSSVQ